MSSVVCTQGGSVNTVFAQGLLLLYSTMLLWNKELYDEKYKRQSEIGMTLVVVIFGIH